MNFALLLFVLTVLTGVAWVIETFVLKKRREALARAQLAEFDQGAALSIRASSGDEAVDRERAARYQAAVKQPLWVEYTASFFPVIAIVFFVRSFLFEPFKIPSGSMVPTLVVGDLILVNKFSYGVRLPIVHTKILDFGAPQRGDVMVFRWPRDTSLDYIKRVVGLPGDEIVYENKVLTVNGQPFNLQPSGDYFDAEKPSYSKEYIESAGGLSRHILQDPSRPAFVMSVADFPYRDHCEYGSAGVRCKVPQGHYFMMGDNRDNSSDSREWGFVPEGNIVGKAFFVWMNFGDLKRIGPFH